MRPHQGSTTPGRTSTTDSGIETSPLPGSRRVRVDQRQLPTSSRRVNAMEWSIILTVLLTVSHVNTRETEKGFTVTTFASNPGIFYEEIGTLSEAKATWRLAVIMDLAALLKREADVSANLRLLLDICEKQGRDDLLCPAIADSVARMVRKIEDGMGTVHDLVKPDSARRRRGLIDGLGSIIESITGNMDAADAERINREIAAIRSNQRTLKESMKDQLQVGESTLHLFNDTFTNVQSNELALQELIAHVNLTLTADLSIVIKEQRLDEGFTALSVIVEALQNDVKELVWLLVEIASGKVSAAVLPPRKLAEYLTDALPHLPTGTGFPVPVERNEASTLMRLADTKAFSQGNAIVVILDFPLISQKR
ncbi:uncharacterized protein LOC112495161 [Cephus cinctus]|uniref:Uncharacterized protein LOC112495161 n=1 Tax=Cephus cinctus TaxID=211228 RepID=A0AAJ7W6Z8_CEPCN|nr:uncharacterized protein LOC112495161 [Cephus cinctus]